MCHVLQVLSRLLQYKEEGNTKPVYTDVKQQAPSRLTPVLTFTACLVLVTSLTYLALVGWLFSTVEEVIYHNNQHQHELQLRMMEMSFASIHVYTKPLAKIIC